MGQYDCFISWSGELSCVIAQHLKNFLITIFDEINIFYSPEIRKGDNGFNAIFEALNNSSTIISVVTTENRNSEWLLYEAGYMDGKGKLVLPYLVNLQHINAPLGLKQYTKFNKEDTFLLIETIARHLNKSNLEHKARFNQNWDIFSECIKGIIAPSHPRGNMKPVTKRPNKRLPLTPEIEEYYS